MSRERDYESKKGRPGCCQYKGVLYLADIRFAKATPERHLVGSHNLMMKIEILLLCGGINSKWLWHPSQRNNDGKRERQMAMPLRNCKWLTVVCVTRVAKENVFKEGKVGQTTRNGLNFFFR